MELIKKVEDFLGPRNWIEKWKIRENRKTENDRELEKRLNDAIDWNDNWKKCGELIKSGVSFDFVDFGGYGTFYWLLYGTFYDNNSEAKEIFKQIGKNRKWEEMERTWTICMIQKEHTFAARIITWVS